jgi:hypothetical protein
MSQKSTKGLTALNGSKMDYDQTAMGLSSITSAVFLLLILAKGRRLEGISELWGKA